MKVDTLTSSGDAAAAMDRRILEQLLMVMMVHSLLQKEGTDDDGDALKKMARECMAANKMEQSGVAMAQLLVVAERMLDAQLLRLLDRGLKGREVLSCDAISDQQLMDTDAAVAKKKRAAAKAAKKKRHKRNKAAAKPKKTRLVSWLGGGVIPLIMVAAFGSITTLIAFSLIRQSDGSSEGEDLPTLPPSASTSLGQRDIQSIISPLPVPAVLAVKSPIFSPSDSEVSNPSMKSDDRAVSTCLDTPNWKDKDGYGCDHYEDMYESGCSGTDKWAGNMGLAINHCCFCGGGRHTLHTTTSSSSICTEDTEGWFDQRGYDCVWYEVVDGPGCPNYGHETAHNNSTVKGSAINHCCFCQIDVANDVSPTVAPSTSETCEDTPGWRDINGYGCKVYQDSDNPGCPMYGTNYTGDKGPAVENCCYCKDPTCEDFNWKCVESSNTWNLNQGETSALCDKAASCSCKTGDSFKTVTQYSDGEYIEETVGLYNECKCDFWSRLCEDTQVGEACDNAAAYCCGDYAFKFKHDSPIAVAYLHLTSPECYCDFYKYAENESGHKLQPRAINTGKLFWNPCGQGNWRSSFSEEKESLEAIYNATNGQDWRSNDGWRDETVDHCQWYGISCDDEGHVTGIDLRDNNLVGQFPVYTHDVDSEEELHWEFSKYGLANLYELQTLDLAENTLTGTIEYRPLYNLRVLTYFDVSGNQLSGEVETLVAPLLKYADFSNNGFTSMRRFEKYKVRSFQTLRYCDVSNNAVQQDAIDILEMIPPNIEEFIASNNQIYGRLPASLYNLSMLRQFEMASNALSGILPGFIESFATLQELDLSNQTNGFTGPIPENLWRHLSLKILNLAGSMLTGTVPSLVGNLAVLEVLDLSSNLLKGSLPSELGLLGGGASLKRLGLSNNAFTGVIPVQVGQLRGASILLKDNRFHNTSTTAPLRLCLEREVKEFDLADDTTLCPPERNALSDFYDSTNGAEWTNGSLWLDEYVSHCDWKGVTCDDDMNHVAKLNLTNNGLSGRLSESIGKLTFMKELDLSDNNIKGYIPIELGKLSNLMYLRLSYNAFTGAVPDGLAEMKGLQLLHLQSNRITGMPTIPRLNDNIHGLSTFVADCGVPSDFDETLECDNCTMCCNADDGCYPQEETNIQKLGVESYEIFAAVLFTCFIALCCMVALLLYMTARRKKIGNSLTSEMETRIKENDVYALSKIGKDSVYSYFVTDKLFGWFLALATIGIQVGILVFFMKSAEANLQNDRTAVEFTWQCPRDTDSCKNKSKLSDFGWICFGFMICAHLATDFIGGSKLIYHSAKITHSFKSRIRYFFGGTCLCSITLFAAYVSTVYNMAIATSNIQIISTAVVVLFVTEIDRWIFSILGAINEDWTAHAALSEDEMKEQITSQQEEVRNLRKILEMIQESQVQREEITSQQKEIKQLSEIVEKIQVLYASAHSEDVY